MNNEKEFETLFDDEIVDVITDANTELTDTPAYQSGQVTAKDILSFAKLILAVLGVIFVIAMIGEWVNPGNSVFETCKLTIPSLATLVIGYYFGTAKS